MPEPTALFQSRIHLKICLVASARGLSMSRRSQPSPVRRGCKTRNYTACISWVGGMVSISPTVPDSERTWNFAFRFGVNGASRDSCNSQAVSFCRCTTAAFYTFYSQVHLLNKYYLSNYGQKTCFVWEKNRWIPTGKMAKCEFKQRPKIHVREPLGINWQ